ncbi:hypothetical protein LJR030_000129 [Rhizobium sp. LjRoot30]|uniref:hypothetical protein n=1 Tax=Rhizobium sp. LjRoot30 TaxID=3342320 RepID=UPI003ECD7A6D
MKIVSRAELTIDEKTPDGFRITYIRRGTTGEGDDSRLPLIRSATQALDNIPVRATTDLSGKPVRVDNLEEAKAALLAAADRITAPFKDKPETVAVLNQIMSGFIFADPASAAQSYLDDLPQLAMAQNTGMALGETRHSSDTTTSPLGGGTLKTSSTFQFLEADPDRGRRIFTNTTVYDPDSVNAIVRSLTARVMANTSDKATPAQIESIVRQMEVSLDERVMYEVEDGMTRQITEKSVTVVRAMGRGLDKTQIRIITVTRAP